MGTDCRRAASFLPQPTHWWRLPPNMPTDNPWRELSAARMCPNYSETAVSDDAQLIDQALGGQSEAFGLLVLKYQDRLFNTVFHVVGQAEDARDIVQEALVQAYLKLASFRRESPHFTRGCIGSR